MRREEDVRRRRIGESVATLRDQPRDRIDVALAVVPCRNDDILHLAQLLVGVVLGLEEAQARAGRGYGELRVEWQHHKPVDRVTLDVCQGLLGEGVPVAHADVGLDARQTARLEGLLERLALLDGGRELRRSSADGLVALAARGSSRSGDDPREGAVGPLEEGGERDDLGVGEEVVQKGLDLVEGVRSTKVEQQHAGALAKHRRVSRGRRHRLARQDHRCFARPTAWAQARLHASIQHGPCMSGR
mmetsp:Transcript_37921/g.83472  ORF Transcript_37921/g.83472 Transcript_37921/m.83472 type:complete len:245 (+) Transcript_37921:1183-1917(+)